MESIIRNLPEGSPLMDAGRLMKTKAISRNTVDRYTAEGEFFTRLYMIAASSRLKYSASKPKVSCVERIGSPFTWTSFTNPSRLATNFSA
ncbi:hypothetical protein D3C75_798000 [compost metagenome]